MMRAFKHKIQRLGALSILQQTQARKRLHRSRHQRHRCHISADMTLGNQHVPAVIKNINKYGALIATQHRFRLGEKIHLSFPLLYLEPNIEIMATVVWTAFDSAGMQFDNI